MVWIGIVLAHPLHLLAIGLDTLAPGRDQLGWIEPQGVGGHQRPNRQAIAPTTASTRLWSVMPRASRSVAAYQNGSGKSMIR